MKRYKGRNAVACTACHAQKLKCPGGLPCQRCLNRGRECLYPKRDKLISIPESYLRELEREVAYSRQQLAAAAAAAAATTATTATAAAATITTQSTTYASSASHISQSPDTSSPTLARTQPSFDYEGSQSAKTSDASSQRQHPEECSAERFVQKLKELSTGTEPLHQLQHDSAQSPPNGSNPEEGYYTYSRLKFDLLQPPVTFRLPPRPYTFYLFQQFEEGFCDYHWFLRGHFRQRLELTYTDPGSQSGDRNWLCRVFVVLALAETWIHGRTASSLSDAPEPKTSQSDQSPSSGADRHSPLPPPPGSEFFEQGLLLLKTSPEQPSTEDIETFNLIAFYCYNLNRRRTACSYASQSVALCRLLHLDKPRNGPCRSSSSQESTSIASRVCNEHRKRLWWTSYCMDRMVTTELGLSPAQTAAPDSVPLPSSHDLSLKELEEFFEAQILSAQAQLCEIKRSIANAVADNHLRNATADAVSETLSNLKPCLDALLNWRSGMAPHVTFQFEDGIPPKMMELPFARVLASLYLRYHQCFILLLRPFYLRELALILQKRNDPLTQPSVASPYLSTTANVDDNIRSLMLECLNAARYNCKILVDLCHYGKISKFGYWESTHLFSGLAILSLARVTVSSEADRVETATTASAEDEPAGPDAALYTRARALLDEMARMGNPAAKDHDALLSDVEAMVKHVSMETSRMRRASEVQPWGQSWSVADLGFEGVPGDQVWLDMHWETLLNSYMQGV